MNAPVGAVFSDRYPLAQFLWLLARSLALSLLWLSPFSSPSLPDRIHNMNTPRSCDAPQLALGQGTAPSTRLSSPLGLYVWPALAITSLHCSILLRCGP